MNKVKIISDSACDLPKHLLVANDIDYISMICTLGDTDYRALLGWENLSPTELYTMMRNGVKPMMSLIKDVDFKEKFEEYLSQGYDIVYIAVSSGLSASIKGSYRVREELKEKYPNQQIHIVDSLVGDMSQGLICLRAAELRDEGKSSQEIYEALENEKFNYHQCGTVSDLKYLRNAGRVKASAAFFANLIGIKPILISDIEGKNVPIAKIRGRKQSIEYMADYVKNHIVDPEKHLLSIIHADCYEDAVLFKEEILKRVPNVKEIMISDCGWIIGCSAGPTTLNVYFYGVKRTE